MTRCQQRSRSAPKDGVASLFQQPLRRLGHLNGSADVGVVLTLGDQIFSSIEFADDLIGYVARSFHDELAGPVNPYEDSHLPWGL